MHNDPPQDTSHSAPPCYRMPAMSLDDLADLFERTHAEMQGRAGRAVDLYLVVRNWLFGWYVVEFEQGGSDRAAYGEGLIRELSRRLSARGMKGVSTTNIKQFRSFYLSRREIGQAATDLSSEGEAKGQALTDLLSSGAVTGPDGLQGVVEALVCRFRLSWTHYVVLLTIDDAGERHFYEIEAAANQWSVRELERQIASSLYERLALSRDREEVARLAREDRSSKRLVLFAFGCHECLRLARGMVTFAATHATTRDDPLIVSPAAARRRGRHDERTGQKPSVARSVNSRGQAAGIPDETVPYQS